MKAEIETPTAMSENAALDAGPAASQRQEPLRRRLPDERQAIVHHFNVGGYEGYLTVGLYEDGWPGEIFITTAKEGSTVSGLMDCFATAVSLALQYGVPVNVLCGKFSHTRFEPSGWSGNPKIGYAKSLMDYLFRWMALKFLSHEPSPSPSAGDIRILEATPVPASDALSGNNGSNGDAPACRNCGAIMERNGPTYRCGNCGLTSERS